MSAAVGYMLLAMNGPVRVVHVTGDLSIGEREQVSRAVVAALDRTYLLLDLDDVLDPVLALSWPREVKVRRIWPRGVAVEVTKEVFVARWGSGGVLNSAGQVIVTPDEELEGLPLIECAAASGARAMQVFQMLNEVLGGRDLQVAAIRENAIGEWQVEFLNDLSVDFGNDDLLGRLERFVRVYDGLLNTRLADVSRVDARYANGIAVDWIDGVKSPAGSVQVALAAGTLRMDR
jgi:cell division protein FtsQ